MLVRVAAVIAVAISMVNDQVDWRRAAATFKTIGGGVPARLVVSHTSDFVKRSWINFINTGSVNDAPRSGRPPLLPDEEAARAAELVKQGQWLWRLPRSLNLKTQVLFRSIPQAIHAVPELGQICRDYGITSDQLRTAMERVDPDLTRHTLNFKYAHSAELLTERQDFSKRMLGSLAPTAAARAAQLNKMIFWDEGGVAISALEHQSIQVWGSREAMQSCDVLHLPAVRGQADCKIHFGIGVTAHPKFEEHNGLVHFDFTTGTTHLKRLHNKFADDGGEEREYRVSTPAFTN